MSDEVTKDCSKKEDNNNPDKDCPKGILDSFEIEEDGNGNPTGVSFNGEGLIPCLDIDADVDCYQLSQVAFMFLRQGGNRILNTRNGVSNSPLMNTVNNIIDFLT